MEQPKELPLEEQVGAIRKDITELSRKLKISQRETLALLSHREIVILNTQLRAVHEMLDLLYGKKAKKRG